MPSYCVTHAIIVSSSYDLLVQAQPKFDKGLWAFDNLLGDAVFLVALFFVGLGFVVLVESGVFEKVRELTFWSIP